MASKVRLPVGRSGGRPVIREFWFAPQVDGWHPSEQEAIRTERIYPPNMLGSWSWAISHAELNDLWVVVPLDTSSPEARAKDINILRASIWRTGVGRRGHELTSTVFEDRMYIRSVK
jgi:hypothetical protein